MERHGDESESVFKPGPRVTDCRFGTDRVVGWGYSVTNHQILPFFYLHTMIKTLRLSLAMHYKLPFDKGSKGLEVL
jgi:hypothetical protein